MKKLSTLIIAIALVVGASQCKKNVEPITSGSDEVVYITMRCDNGGKHIVYPGTGAVVYSSGDKVYVGNNGKYIGTLTYSDGTFNGIITNPSTSDYLHFYFVGGLMPSSMPSSGSTTSFTVNIADQSDSLPVLLYGQSNEKYTTGTATYSCTLDKKCGLVKFVPSIATTEMVTVGGMKTVATVNFATPGITPTGIPGDVTLYPESNSAKWAILLPQDEVSSPPVNISGTNFDWGVYNKQSNQNKILGGGDHAWRTLTKDEWVYLFNTRSNTTVNGTSNARFTKAAITTPSKGTVNGVIIFPDEYSGGTPSGVNWGTINGTDNDYTTICTAAGWEALESVGCVFLPAAGCRRGTEVYGAGSDGRYWSSTSCYSNNAYDMGFNSSVFNPQHNYYRYFGYSVRLVY